MSDLDATIWVGKEKEYEQNGLKMFVDGASLQNIESALDELDAVREIHFAHKIHWDVVRQLIEKIEITVEVDNLDAVPRDLVGRINTIYRVPSWVDKAKVRSGREITVADFDEIESEEWDGKKVYDDDTVIQYE
jgi:hypothetical protein